MATGYDDLRVLQTCETIADELWREVLTWGKLAQDVVGKQMARSADSIGANIAEAYGRYHFGDKLNFLYYARGSLFETKYWLNRSQKRGLLNGTKVQNYATQLANAARQINAFANSLKKQKSPSPSQPVLREPHLEYNINIDEIPLFTQSDLDWLQTITEDNNFQSPISNP